jgi:transcriptional regulator of aroF, aroG, tyrA and aromatic amino acid transport
VLQTGVIERLGSCEPIRVNVRILAATHRDLLALVAEGKFREDLYHRLNCLTVRLPPLRERKGDIELLARVFLARMFPDRCSRPALHPEALQRLQEHHWPGNVRQLQKVLCRAAGTCRGRHIFPEDIDFGVAGPQGPAPVAQDALRAVVEAAWRDHPADDLWAHLQKQLQRQLLEHAQQPRISDVKLARRLGVSRNLVRQWRQEFGFQGPPDDSEPLSA